MWTKLVGRILSSIVLLASIPAFATVNASLTITGTEQPGDSSTITIAFNGISETVAYSQYSSAASIASAFGGKFAKDFGSIICVHAVGTKILFSLKSDGVFGSVTVTDSNTSFQVDTSFWPSNLINPLVELQCNPDSVVSGSTTSCTASVGGTATGTVSFYLDNNGSAFTSASLTSGSATVSSVSLGTAIGNHIITARYSGDGSHTAGGVDTSVALVPTPGSLTQTQVYSYNITTYQANGNIQAYTDQVNGSWSALSYDGLNRLVSGQVPMGGHTQYFCANYDSLGNRLNEAFSTTTCSSSPTPILWANYNSNNQITASSQAPGGIAATTGSLPGNGMYDLAGNTINDGVNRYLYDDDGRVCAVQSSGPFPGMTTLTQYIYDADGRRVAKGAITTFSCDITSNGFTRTASYGLDTAGHQVTETDGNGEWQHTNVYAGGVLLATYDDDGAHFHASDWLGSRRVQTDYLGRVEDTYASLPFGEFLPSNNLTDLGATEQHFTGKERDPESGLDYFKARYYGSITGRFLSPDWSAQEEPVPYAKLDNPQSLNLYDYVQNNPLSNVDVDGHFWKQLLNWIITGCDCWTSDRGTAELRAHSNYMAQTAYRNQQEQNRVRERQLQFMAFAMILSHGEVPIEGGGTPESGTGNLTVLGHYTDGYIDLAKELNANYFNIPTAEWDALTPEGQWGKNQQFLDEAISRGDRFRLATPLSKVRPGSFYEKEINYLTEKGYFPVETPEGTELIRPQVVID